MVSYIFVDGYSAYHSMWVLQQVNRACCRLVWHFVSVTCIRIVRRQSIVEIVRWSPVPCGKYRMACRKLWRFCERIEFFDQRENASGFGHLSHHLHINSHRCASYCVTFVLFILLKLSLACFQHPSMRFACIVFSSPVVLSRHCQLNAFLCSIT